MKAIVVNTPHPACILNLADPARAYVGSSHTDVKKTWEQHAPINPLSLLDDYALTDRLGYLETLGAWK